MKAFSILGLALLCCSFIVSCSNNYEEESSLAKNKEEVQSSLKNSKDAENNIPEFKDAIASELSLSVSSRAIPSIEEYCSKYDFSVQQEIKSSTKDGTVYLVQNKLDKNNFLALYKKDGIILNVKELNINADKSQALVEVLKVDGTDYITLSGNSTDKIVNVLSYNEQYLSMGATRNGCSVCIGGAGLIWGTAFGCLSMGAGFAAGLVFMALSEAMC